MRKTVNITVNSESHYIIKRVALDAGINMAEVVEKVFGHDVAAQKSMLKLIKQIHNQKEANANATTQR